MARQENFDPGRDSEKDQAESIEISRLLTELDEIEAQITKGIGEQGTIIQSRPESDAQYARLEELASVEAQLRVRETEILKRLKELRSK